MNAASKMRPVPVPDEVSAGYWNAAARGALALARCAACGGLTHPPGPVCGACHSTDPDWSFAEIDGRGVIRSWTVLRKAFLPGFADELPIVLVDVELDADVADRGEGRDLRLIGRLLDGPAAPVRLGAPVVVAFEHLDGGAAVPAFALVEP